MSLSRDSYGQVRVYWHTGHVIPSRGEDSALLPGLLRATDQGRALCLTFRDR
jgi:hypothetical protein